MRPYLADWIAEIKTSGAESHRLRTQAEAVKLLNKERRHVKPLVEQIEALMASLPPALRDRPWSMADLTNRLQGKYRDHPHPQNVGQALRILGFKRIRAYGDFEGVRLWIQK